MNNIEIKLLKLLLNRDFFLQYGERISIKVLNKELKGLLKSITHLHKSKLDTADLTTSEVYDLYSVHNTVTDARLQLIRNILDEVDNIDMPSHETVLLVLEKMYEKEAARQIAEKALLVMQRTDDTITLEDVKDFVNNLSVEKKKEELAIVNTDLGTVLDNMNLSGNIELNNGLEFIGDKTDKLSKGDFVIVFAVPNAGKSSFAAQLTVGFLKQKKKVLYFVNEGTKEKAALYFIRNAERKSVLELKKDINTPIWDTLQSDLFLISAHGFTLQMLEKYIKAISPDIVIIDQLDNVVYGTREKLHENLEKLYQSARLIAAENNCLMVALSQASAEAHGKTHLNTTMLSNSKTGKAGTGDLILGIGMQNDLSDVRSITICKNKNTGIHETIFCKLNNKIASYEP